ncbi:MAG TPA: ABC transporter substrate-binding protein, partial [Kofleriaceae bacterium]
MVVILACGHPARRTPDDTLVVVLQDKAITVDPRFTLSNYDAAVSKLVAIGLTTVSTADARPAYALAADVRQIDPVTLDITLADRKFSDGSQVTADDVARTYQSIADPRCGSLYTLIHRDRWKLVEALDPMHVRMHLAQPLGTIMSDIDVGIISFHGVPPGSCDVPHVIGAGPYVLRELTPYLARFDANPYFPTPAKLPHLELRFVTDAAARLLMLVGGSADLLENAVRPDLVDDVATQSHVAVHAEHSLLLTYMMLNLEDPILRDLRVREAIALALDRPAIIHARFADRAV